jgi:hypothetical protein
VYYWKNNEWKQINDQNHKDNIHTILKQKAKQNKDEIFAKYKPQLCEESYFNPYFEYFEDMMEYNGYFYGDDFDHEYHKYKGINICGVNDSLKDFTTINRNFPMDVFTTSSGSFNLDKKSRLIILSRSGLYSAYNQKIKKLNNKGLIATDVRQIVHINDEHYVCLVGISEIWQYKTGNWSLIFDAYTYAKENNLVEKNYTIHELILQSNNHIYFGFCGNIYDINPSGSVSLFLESRNKLSADSKYMKGEKELTVYFFSAARDKDNIVWGTAYVKNISNKSYRYYNRKYFLYKIVDNEVNIISKLNQSWGDGYNSYPFVFVDKSNKIWLCSDGRIEQLGEGADPKSNTWIGKDKWINSFSSNDKGELALINYNEVIIWKPEESKWEIIELDIEASYDYDKLRCISLTNEGDIFIGTGMQYKEGCGQYYIGAASGLYKLSHDSSGYSLKKIHNDPNPWILSLAPHTKYGLAVGTSGSGMLFVKTVKAD